MALVVLLAGWNCVANAQATIITNMAVPWHAFVVNANLNKFYFFGGQNNSPQTVVMDGTTYAQVNVGPGWGDCVDLGNNNYWAATVYAGNVIVRSGATDAVLGQVSLGFCPMMTASDASNRRIWVGAQCGGDMVWALNADTYAVIAGPLNTGGVMSSIIANPVTGRAYPFSSTTSLRVKPPVYALTVNAFGRVVAVHTASNLLYAIPNPNALQILDGAPDPEVLQTTIATPFPINGNTVAVNPVLNRLYLGSGNSSSIAVLNAATGESIGTISLGGSVTGVAYVAVDAVRHRVAATVYEGGSPRFYLVQEVVNQPPVAACQDITVPNDPGACSATVAASAVGDGSSDPDGDPITMTLAPTGPYPPGSNLVTLVVTDSHGASNSCTATIVVQDSEPPAIQCPANIVQATDSGLCTAVVTYTATATDNCDTPTVVCTPPAGSAFPKGTNTVACTATDTAGNVTPCSFSVTVEDREPPVITCPGNLVAEFQNEQGAVVPCVVTASDTCSPVAVTVTPPCGSVFPIGLTTVNALALETSGNSNSCSFTVRVLGAFGVKSNVLAELIALRSTVTAKDDGDKLDQAIQKLTESLDASLWLDQTHLERKHGEKVFQGEKDAAIKLCDLIKSPRSTIPDAVLQGFLERIVKSDRLLAQVAINEAIVAQVAAKKIAEAQKELAKGDEEATDGKCGDGIERYRQAWKHAVHSKVYSYIDKENGQLHLEILGKPHEQFTVQVSTNLVDWQTIATQAADADGLLDFVDAHAGEPGVRYYRAVSQ